MAKLLNMFANKNTQLLQFIKFLFKHIYAHLISLSHAFTHFARTHAHALARPCHFLAFRTISFQIASYHYIIHSLKCQLS